MRACVCSLFVYIINRTPFYNYARGRSKMRKFRTRAEQLHLFIRIGLHPIVGYSRRIFWRVSAALGFISSSPSANTEPAIAAAAESIQIVAEIAIAIAQNAIRGMEKKTTTNKHAENGRAKTGVGECAIISVGCQIIFRRIPSTKIHIMCLMR